VAQAGRDVLTEGEVQVAIRDLSEADLVRLRQAGKALEKVCRLSADDLLHEALTRVLDGTRQVPRTEKFLAVLYMAMKSIASSDGKRHDNSRVDEVEDEELNKMEDSMSSPDAGLVRNDARKIVMALFEGDEIAQTICEGWLFEDMTDKELGDLTGLDAKKVASAKKAIFRALRKSKVGAQLT
jgi:RNA polymerase sporulation-specific sigma factor